MPRKVFDFTRGNFDDLRNSLLDILPDFTMSTDSIDNCWKRWKKLFLGAVHKLFQQRSLKTKIVRLGLMAKFAISLERTMML